MGKGYSIDIRERVARDVSRGQTVRAVAQRFEVSVASVVRWSRLSRASGSVAPGRQGRRPGGGKLAAFMVFLTKSVEEKPDITMPELAEKLTAYGGLVVRPASLSRVLCKAGYTYKKTVDGKRMRTR
jgi:transposase